MSKYILFLLLLSFASSSFSQKKHWISYDGSKSKKHYATYYYTFNKIDGAYLLKKYNNSNDKLIESVRTLKNDINTKNGTFEAYYENGNILTRGEYLNNNKIKYWKSYYKSGEIMSITFYDNGLKEKTFYEFFPNGDTTIIGSFKNNLKVGLWVTYNSSGNISSETNYLNGALYGESKCFYDNGKLHTVTTYVNDKKETLFYTEEGKLYIPASFKNKKLSMMSYLAKNTKYPIEAIERNIQGSAYIAFTVDEKGGITNVHSAALPGKEVHQLLVKEAIRVVSSMPTWNPATSEGKPIPTYFSVPVNFKIR